MQQNGRYFVGSFRRSNHDYGINPQYSKECIFIWADSFDVNVQANRKPVSSTISHEPIVHAPILEQVIVEGLKSDYETSLENGSLTIKKFIGFDEEEIIIPNHIDGIPVKTIGENAFAKCTNIKKVIVSEGITFIDNGAFSECSSLKDVVLPVSLQKIGSISSYGSHAWMYKGVFYKTSIEKILLPADLEFIGGKTFENCGQLRKINLPNKVKTIPEDCFHCCWALNEVLLPDSLNSIEIGAFGSTGIAKIDIPVSVSTIGDCAFKNCKNLSQVLLHEGLVTIGDSVFEDCKALNAITIPKSVTHMGMHLFDITGWYQPYDRRRKIEYTRDRNKNLVISCYAGSAGLEYARKEGYQVQNAASK